MNQLTEQENHIKSHRSHNKFIQIEIFVESVLHFFKQRVVLHCNPEMNVKVNRVSTATIFMYIFNSLAVCCIRIGSQLAFRKCAQSDAHARN